MRPHGEKRKKNQRKRDRDKRDRVRGHGARARGGKRERQTHAVSLSTSQALVRTLMWGETPYKGISDKIGSSAGNYKKKPQAVELPDAVVFAPVFFRPKKQTRDQKGKKIQRSQNPVVMFTRAVKHATVHGRRKRGRSFSAHNKRPRLEPLQQKTGATSFRLDTHIDIRTHGAAITGSQLPHPPPKKKLRLQTTPMLHARG